MQGTEYLPIEERRDVLVMIDYLHEQEPGTPPHYRSRGLLHEEVSVGGFSRFSTRPIEGLHEHTPTAHTVQEPAVVRFVILQTFIVCSGSEGNTCEVHMLPSMVLHATTTIIKDYRGNDAVAGLCLQWSQCSIY
jgi:hypothetical protein